MLAAVRGAKIRIEAEGDDAEEVVAALVSLAKAKFYMSY
jgi:phosphocarrier protein